MKSTTAILSLFFYWAFLVSMTNAAPQQTKAPGKNINIGTLSPECDGAFRNSVQTIMSSCVSDLAPLAFTPVPTNPEDQLRLFFNGTSTLCGSECLGTLSEVSKNINGNCSKPDSPDENVNWFFKHSLFGGRVICAKSGDQLCVNKAVEQAKDLNIGSDVLPVLQSFASSINIGELTKIPQSNQEELSNIGFNFMDRLLTKLPAKVLCGGCQTNMATQVNSYLTNVYKPVAVNKFKMPDPSRRITSLATKAVTKCSASAKSSTSTPPASGKKQK
ncbi:hypothetical protein BKA69DRAFT_1121628 [Paraphysoderma sedebokerense]|nr:hypothetical protein BKA69DRAFT_1121628 [Paraphysoderma sedebokerense]